MNYQLLHSFEKQKHSNKIDSRYNFSSLSRYMQQQPRQSQVEQQFSFQSPMPIKLVHYKAQSRTLPDQSECQIKQQKLRYRVKHKKFHLPSIEKRQQKIKAITRSYQPSTHKLVKKRAQTQITHPEDSEQTIVKISQINDRLNEYRRSKLQKQNHKYKQHDSREKDNPYGRMKQHNSKQKEYEEYVHQLQSKYKSQHSRISMPHQQAQIQQKLRNRIETKKYVYCKPFNPEIKQTQKELQQSSLSHSKLSRNTIKQQVQEAQKNLQTTQDQEEANRQRKRNAINDDFIKILRKAKNRGASLLIKLKKFPSQKLIAK